MTTFVRYGVYFLTVFLFMFFGKLSVMAGGLFVLAGLINIGLKYGLWLNLFVNRYLLRIQTDDEFAEKIKKGATSFGFWGIDSLTLIPAILYLLLLTAFPWWWHSHNPGLAVPAGLEEGVAFTPITAFMLVFLEGVLKLLVPAIKITGANITTTEVPYESMATMHVHVVIGIALVFFVAWAFTTWDDRIRVINDVPVNRKGEEAGWQSWVNWFFRNLLVRLGIPLVLALITLRTGVWNKTIVPIKSNDAAIVLHEMMGFHTPEYDKLITRLRKRKMPDTPLGNEVAELTNPTAPAPVTYDNPTPARQTPAPTYTPSSSGSKSKGGGIGSWLVWVIVLVFVVGLFLWLKKKGKLPAMKTPGFKIPSFRFGRRKKGPTDDEVKESFAALQNALAAGGDTTTVGRHIEVMERFLVDRKADLDDNAQLQIRGLIAQVQQKYGASNSGHETSGNDVPSMEVMQAIVTRLQNALRGGADLAEVEQDIGFVEANIAAFPEYTGFLKNLVVSVRQRYPEQQTV